IVRVFLDAARAQAASGHLDEAERNLRLGIAEAERQRAGVTGSQLRVSFTDQVNEIFDEMVAFQIDHRHNVSSAFEYAERGRARDLVDLAGGQADVVGNQGLRPNNPLTVAALSSLLPHGFGLIEYAVLPDRLVAWLVADRQVRFFEQGVEATRL